MAWLADVPVHPLQQTLKDLERAYANFFAKRAEFPHFKQKGQHDSFRYLDLKQIQRDHGNSREVIGTMKNVTVSRTGSWPSIENTSA